MWLSTRKELIHSFHIKRNYMKLLSTTKKPEVQIRAISELHSIEMSIFSLWKQLPDLDIVDSPQQEESLNKDKSPYINIETVMPEDRDRIFPIAICRCEGTQQHYACYKCLRAFCRPDSDNTGNNGTVRCPLCKTVVYYLLLMPDGFKPKL